MPKCQATTTRGNACKSNALDNSKYCRTHADYGDENVSHDNASHGSETISAPSKRTPFGSESMSRSEMSNDSEMLGSLVEKVEKLEKMMRGNLAASKASSSRSKKAVKPPRMMTDKTAAIKARWIYYNELKDTEDVVTAIRGGLVQGNMLTVKKITLDDGSVVEKEQIPYQLKKIYIDIKFDALSDVEKRKYVRMAWEDHGEKVAAAVSV